MRLSPNFRILIVIFVIGMGLYHFRLRSRAKPVVTSVAEEAETLAETPNAIPNLAQPTPLATEAAKSVESASSTPGAGVSMTVEGKKVFVPASTGGAAVESENLEIRDFKTEDGVAVIDGDIVIGAPVSGAASGAAQLPTLQMWPSRVIPYFIQPSLENPSRIQEALRLFSGTAIQFIPYTDQEDVLVFQSASGTCKSYVGRIGGKQPLWISKGCGPFEIAHEIMHALGFTHEQNRFDRDRFIRIHPENIESDRVSNFERMPETFMEISGLEDFSYSSIMIYAPDVFSKNGRPTMTSLNPNSAILPGDQLDRADVNRLNRYYGNR